MAICIIATIYSVYFIMLFVSYKKAYPLSDGNEWF